MGFEKSEPYDGKLSRTILWGGNGSNVVLLPDYASIELLYHPELREKPVAVVGDIEQRHGILLTANPIAKKFGVKTGEPIWQARQKCHDLVTLAARYDLYMQFSKAAREINEHYTDLMENFGLDLSIV